MPKRVLDLKKQKYILDAKRKDPYRTFVDIGKKIGVKADTCSAFHRNHLKMLKTKETDVFEIEYIVSHRFRRFKGVLRFKDPKFTVKYKNHDVLGEVGLDDFNSPYVVRDYFLEKSFRALTTNDDAYDEELDNALTVGRPRTPQD